MIAVETIGLGFNHWSWAADTRQAAEAFAQRMSVAVIDNPCYPNPYFVLENGRPVARFYRGEKLPDR